MPSPKHIPQKYKPWLNARKKFKLPDAQIQMARELGLNPKKFGSLANHKQESWKAPLPEYIEDLYFKHFNREAPENVRSIEEIAADSIAKKDAKNPDEFYIRNLEPEDYDTLMPLVKDWWGGQDLSSHLPRLFFTHFRNSSFVAVKEKKIIGFLVGFRSQTYPKQACIHFAGVHPEMRKVGVGRALYKRFFAASVKLQCKIVYSIASPDNKDSIAFHQRMGFEIQPGGGNLDGISFTVNYDGKGKDRVVFRNERLRS